MDGNVWYLLIYWDFKIYHCRKSVQPNEAMGACLHASNEVMRLKEGPFLLRHFYKVPQTMAFLAFLGKGFAWIQFYSSSFNCWLKRKKAHCHSGLELTSRAIALHCTALCRMSLAVRFDIDFRSKSLGVKFIGPSAIGTTKAQDSSSKKLNYRRPSLYCPYWSHIRPIVLYNRYEFF